MRRSSRCFGGKGGVLAPYVRVKLATPYEGRGRGRACGHADPAAAGWLGSLALSKAKLKEVTALARSTVNKLDHNTNVDRTPIPRPAPIRCLLYISALSDPSHALCTSAPLIGSRRRRLRRCAEGRRRRQVAVVRLRVAVLGLERGVRRRRVKAVRVAPADGVDLCGNQPVRRCTPSSRCRVDGVEDDENAP